jgi:uncharacterized membrane protein (DUF441 family)
VPAVAKDRRQHRMLRGAAELAVLLAVLSLLLPGRGIKLFLGALVVGFVVGLVAEVALVRRRRRRHR